MADKKKKQDEVLLEEEVSVITLKFDDETEEECEIIGVFDCEGKEYIALLPEGGEGDVYLYIYKDLNEEEFDILDIEDEEEFERAAAEFDRLAID